MEESMTRPYRLTEKLSQLFDLESKIETVLSVSIYYLNQFMDSERSSIFLFQHWDQQLTIFSSLDLEKHEVRIPKSCGVAGWVFTNREPTVVNNASEDSRFYKDIDDMTGFKTRNLICTPLLFSDHQCLGTIQSMNKREGNFTNDDLELLKLAAGMVAIAINNSKRYNELLVTNEARKNFINKITANTGNIFNK
jgi:adenylate cyclase